MVKLFDDIKYGSSRVPVPEKSEHELTFGKAQCQQDFSTFSPFDRAHLDNRAVRSAFQETKEISIGAPDATGLVCLERIMGL